LRAIVILLSVLFASLLSLNVSAKSTVIDGLDFGPIAGLVGNWQGDKGVDVAPGKATPLVAPYFETINVEVVGDVTNAGAQKFAVLSYHQEVFRKSDGKKFHDQIGYWIYDAKTKEVHHTISIPRAVTVMASGKAAKDGSITVSTSSEIGQSQFMLDNAKTTKFEMTLRVNGDNLSYSMTTHLDIYGKEFPHTDVNVLTRK
jgi:hypothetical protein